MLGLDINQMVLTLKKKKHSINVDIFEGDDKVIDYKISSLFGRNQFFYNKIKQ